MVMVLIFVLFPPGCRREEDRREPEDPGGLLHDGLHQQGLPHHGQVRAGRQSAEGGALRNVVVTRAAAEWVGVGRSIFRRNRDSTPPWMS